MPRSATCTVALAVVVGGLIVAGCGGGDASRTTADRTPETIADGDRPQIPTTEPTSEPSPTPTPAAAKAATAGLDPCALLTASEERQIGLTPGRPRQVGLARSCEWTASRYALSVAAFDTLGARDLVSDTKPRDLRIGSHAARQGTGGVNSCVYALGVSKTSRVDVIVAADGNTQRGCRIARRIAPLVEPKLP
jgi:hypothetical protein